MTPKRPIEGCRDLEEVLTGSEMKKDDFDHYVPQSHG